MIRIFSEKEVTDVTVVPDDFFVKFVKKYYFPFQQRFHRHICIGWLIVFVICIVYGPAFLSSTKNSLDLPASAPSVQAINVYAQYFPNSGNKPPAIIIQETKGLQSNIINDYTKNFSTALNQYASKHKDVVSFVSGYWEMIDVQDEEIIAQQSVSKSNSTMKSTVYFTKQSSIAQSNDFVKTLIDFTVQQSNSQNYVATTGLSALFYEMQLSTSTSFELIDATVIPLAILILGANLQSYRHMLIAFCNLGCTLLLAFALLMPVTYIFDINPFSPSIMLSLGVAVSFDYSLFMLNRFREEIIEKRNSRQYAVLSCVCMAGHVVCLSGCILLFTFVLLITFPQNFLQSVGISCAAVVFAALLTNMSLTPALLLTFECFSFFDFCPSRESVCCYMSPEYKASHLRDYQNTDNTGVKVLNATKSVEDPSEERKEADFTQDSGNSNGLVVSETRDDLGDVELSTPTGGGGVSNSVSSNANANINMTTASGDMANTSSYEELKSNDESVQAPESAPEPSFGVSSESVHRNTLSAWCGPDEVSSLEPQAGQMIYEEPVCDRQKSLFFRCSYAISEHPWLVLFLSAVITAPLLWQVFSLVPTSDNGLIYLPGSRSLDAYNVLKAQYPIGLVDPYSILVVTGTANTIYTEDYFQFETGLISDLLTTSTQYLSTQSLTGVSYCNGHNVSYELAMEYRNTSSSLYHTKDASTYRGLTNGLVNTDQSVTIIQVNTIVDPDSQAISQFIVNTRSLLKSYSAANPLPTGTTTMYLFGGFTTTYDLQQIVYALVPVMVAVTFIAVMLLIGLGFGSVFLTLRLLLTVGMSLSWAYGLMVSITYCF